LQSVNSDLGSAFDSNFDYTANFSKISQHSHNIHCPVTVRNVNN